MIYYNKSKQLRRGSGLLNSFINKLPFEMHIPGYNYCGPGTKLRLRLSRGDKGINKLDEACKAHDIAYAQSSNLSRRHEADRILAEKAWQRVKSSDASIGEKAAAWSVTNIMKGKRKLGMGLRTKKKHSLKSVIKKVQKSLKSRRKIGTLIDASNIALKSAQQAVKQAGGKSNILKPRVLPIPKTGGFLPLIPLFAGLSALGGLAAGASSIAKTVNQAKAASKTLEESKRHNEKMEAIALGKKGSGLFLKPYRKGLGVFLNPSKKKI